MLRRARGYVSAYLRRGAVVPPSACESCDIDVVDNGVGRRPLPLRFFHPDPARPKHVVWLCSPCFKRVSATCEVVESFWTWPGYESKYVRTPRQDEIFAIVAAVDASLIGNRMLPGLRMQSLVFAALSFLTSKRRERFYRDGVAAGRNWSPTGSPAYDAAFVEWVRSERRRRGDDRREAGGTVMVNMRKVRAIRQKVVSAPVLKVQFVPCLVSLHDSVDTEAVLGRMADAHSLADDTNARIEALFGFRPRSK